MLIAGRRIARALASMLMSGSLIAGCATSTQPPPDMDGLVLQPSQGLDAVYLRPGTNFKDYGNIVLQPVQVEFDKSWDPNSPQPDVSRRLSELEAKSPAKLDVTFRVVAQHGSLPIQGCAISDKRAKSTLA